MDTRRSRQYGRAKSTTSFIRSIFTVEFSTNALAFRLQEFAPLLFCSSSHKAFISLPPSVPFPHHLPSLTLLIPLLSHHELDRRAREWGLLDGYTASDESFALDINARVV